MYWDGPKDHHNIMSPEPYSSLQHNREKWLIDLAELDLFHNVPWIEKSDKAFFRGHATGRSALNGERRDRSLLMHLSTLYPDHLEVYKTGSDVEEEIPLEKSTIVPFTWEVGKKKYCIIIDGHIHSWGRPTIVLYSTCVPLVVESRF